LCLSCCLWCYQFLCSLSCVLEVWKCCCFFHSISVLKFSVSAGFGVLIPVNFLCRIIL
jgi:hypothetical protein